MHGKTPEELQEIIDNPKSVMLIIMVASVMKECLKSGDWSRLAFLLDRAVGKVPEVKESVDEREAREERERIENLSDEELVALAREKIPELGPKT